MAEAQPLTITPFPPLGPPIIGTDVPGSAPGVPQPVIVSGGISLPPSFPLPPAGTWLPPPLLGDGENEIFPTPVVPPGTGASQPQPQFATGSPTVPTAASLFPEYTAPGPFQPIVLTGLMQIGLGPPPFTPGTQPVTVSTAPAIPQLPWNPPGGNVPVNTVRPTITYTALTVGSVLTAHNGTWTGATSYAYEWLRDGSPIDPVAHGATYTLVAADVGEPISVDVTATGPGGEASAESLPVAVPLPVPANIELPVISGTPEVGQVLTASTGLWTNDPTSFAYRWWVNSVQVPGATLQTYTPVEADVGFFVGVEVSAANAGGASPYVFGADNVGPVVEAPGALDASTRAAPRRAPPSKHSKRR